MKTISIIQPWATLIALGEKKFETRSWRTKHRGELAIHASKKIDKVICRIEPFKSVLANHGYTADNLPTGVILAICQLEECNEIYASNGFMATLCDGGAIITSYEYAFGDYSDGRFAWRLSDVEQIEPIPAKGQLGLWESIVNIFS